MLLQDISIRYVARADKRLIAECCRIAGEFLGSAHFLGQSIQESVNVCNNPMFVAENSIGDISGFIVARRPGNRKPVAEISALYVRADMCRNGIGCRLLMRMENYLRDSGVDRVWLTSRPWAVPFYTRCGYMRRASQKFCLEKSL